jgi:hypothetical protein
MNSPIFKGEDTSMRIAIHYLFAALALGFYGGEV